MATWWRLPLEEYDGRLMRCAPGTHAAAGDIMARRVPKTAVVLDLASGTGAFLARLRDLGFNQLNAVELNIDGFKLDGVTPLPVDLNSNFGGAPGDNTTGANALRRDFGLISAIEIIEHLDCPRSFLRNVRELLNDGGYLLLTTPNVSHWLGRVRFLLSGELRQFQRHDYDHQRHISPVTDIQMRLIFEEIGFELIESTTAGTFFGSVKRAIFWPIEAAARLLFGPRASGDVSIYLVRKTPPATGSAGRDSFYFRKTGA